MVESTPSGAAQVQREQLGESHQIRIDRIWAVNPAGAGDGSGFCFGAREVRDGDLYGSSAERVLPESDVLLGDCGAGFVAIERADFFRAASGFRGALLHQWQGVIPKGQGSGTVPDDAANANSTATSWGARRRVCSRIWVWPKRAIIF
jgi:hypothetical protein